MGWAADLLVESMGFKPGETVLVLVDSPLREAGAALSHAAEELGAARVRLDVVDAPGLAAVNRSRNDVAVALFSHVDLSREIPALRAARASAGDQCRWGVGAGLDRTLLAVAAQTDYALLDRIGWAVRSWFCDRQVGGAPAPATVNQVRLSAPGGTDLTFRVAGRPVYLETGRYHTPGAIGNLPGGEVYLAPLEDSAEGLLVVDAALGDIPLDVPVRLRFERGRVTAVSGGLAAAALRDRLGDDPWAWTAGEFGIGIHPDMAPHGPITVAEKALGTAHIALGANEAFGGHNPSAVHYDGVVLGAAIAVDGSEGKRPNELV